MKFNDRISPGGDMFENHRGFIEWAAGYDDGGTDMRSKKLHEEWLEGVLCPVIKIDGVEPVEKILKKLPI